MIQFSYMIYPNYLLERKLLKQGYNKIVGVDEVGRGALAGPMVAAAAVISAQFKPSKYIRDSKLLSERRREKIFEDLSEKVIWSFGLVSHKEIDRLGIARANLLVIKRALRKLAIKPDYLLLDKVNGFKHSLPFESIVAGDRKVTSIAIASILAKVTRDRMMRKLHQKFPQYYFNRHKGYGTKLHKACLKKYGACRIHRLSYKY